MKQIYRIGRRGWRVLRNEGIVQLIHRARNYLQRINISANGINISYQTGSRVDFEDRWDLLKKEVNESDKTLIDIGCAEGQLTARFADLGLFSIGIERQNHTVGVARNANGSHANVGFVEYEVTPTSITGVPPADIVLLLTVHHHWVREYGWENAEQMMRKVEGNSKRLLFEIPKTNIDHPEIGDLDTLSPREQYEWYLDRVSGDGKSVRFVGETSYKGEDRRDLIYIIEPDRTKQPKQH